MRVIQAILMFDVSVPESVASRNRIAAENAAGCEVSFFANNVVDGPCRIHCPSCGENWDDTRIEYYAEYPFGCPTCAPADKRHMWQARVDHEFRTASPEAVQAEMLIKVRRVIYSLPESERGPLFGRVKRIQRDGAKRDDFRWMREMLAPETELVE